MIPLKRVLLVDDSPRDLEMAIDALAACNLANEVLTLADGAQALDYLYQRGEFAGRANGQPVVILLDLKMPKVDGLEVLRQVKADPVLKLIPVVMMTSSREEQDLVRSYELGANAYVVKPVKFSAFVEAVKSGGGILGRHQRASASPGWTQDGARPSMTPPVRILHLEDNSGDAAMIRDRIEAEGLFCEIVWVDTKDRFEAALGGSAFDIVLCDYNLPGYDGISAMKVAHERHPDTPVIVVSGSSSPDDAVAWLKQGASDYLVKERLERLVPALRQALAATKAKLDRERTEAERKQAEEQLRESLLEKEALLKEVHHRVKNNLQVITSLLRLEAGRDVEPSTKSVLKEMQGRIQSMALLHETLYRSGTFASVDLGAYLKQLAGPSFRSLVAEPGAIQFHVDVSPVRVEMDQAMPCGLIVNELISNCLKHGFPGGRTGEVRVELQAVDGGEELRLRVSDTGVGLPANFDVARCTSLGLRLVSDLTRQLQGTLTIGSGPGTSIELRFRPTAPQPAGVPGSHSDPEATLP